MTAIYALELLIGKVFKMASQKANKGIETVAKAEPEQTPVKAIKSFVKAESDGDYQLAVAKWEKQTGNKAEPDSLKVKLQRKTQEVKERENNRKSYHYRSDRGGR